MREQRQRTSSARPGTESTDTSTTTAKRIQFHDPILLPAGFTQCRRTTKSFSGSRNARRCGRSLLR